MKEVVLLVFGGKSVEHDISVITAVQTMKSLPEQYIFLPIYIDKNSDWWTADNLGEIEVYKNFKKLAKNKKEVVLGRKTVFVKKRNRLIESYRTSLALNCCHGKIGEDGSLQGLFNAYDIACTSCGVTSSALCMDKVFVKDVLKANDIPSVEYLCLKAEDEDKTLKEKINFPVVVKPANLGSSIGISVCENESELSEALTLAFNFDRKVLIEKLVENLQEFNCACFEFKGQLFSSDVNEVETNNKIYSFEDKYLSSEANNVDADKKLAKQIKTLTEDVYRLFDCAGVVRVDFLYDKKQEKLYVNEINTIPGSLAVYLYKGVPAQDVLNAIIESAKERFLKNESLISSFDSDAIEIYSKFKPTSKK